MDWFLLPLRQFALSLAAFEIKEIQIPFHVLQHVFITSGERKTNQETNEIRQPKESKENNSVMLVQICGFPQENKRLSSHVKLPCCSWKMCVLFISSPSICRTGKSCVIHQKKKNTDTVHFHRNPKTASESIRQIKHMSFHSTHTLPRHAQCTFSQGVCCSTLFYTYRFVLRGTINK